MNDQRKIDVRRRHRLLHRQEEVQREAPLLVETTQQEIVPEEVLQASARPLQKQQKQKKRVITINLVAIADEVVALREDHRAMIN